MNRGQDAISGGGLARWTGLLGRLGDFVARQFGDATTVHIDPTRQYQVLEGWGTSLAWWGHVVGGWPEPQRSQMADLVFGRENGLGLNIVRYNIGGGDNPTHHHMRPGGDVPGYQPRPGEWDWHADANQRWMLEAARTRGATIFEAFSNSPPYWMTYSGCSAGAADGGNNLKPENDALFAAYLATVAAHFRDEWGITFRTVEPFNEPLATNWKAGNRQEGCHFDHPAQLPLVQRLAAELRSHGLHGTAIAVADDYSIDQAVTTVDAYDAATLADVAQINTHSYEGTQRAGLRERVTRAGKRLWMSEYGTGGYVPHNHAAIEPALVLSAQVRRDLAELRPAAWVYWQAVEDEGGNNNWGFIHAPFAGTNHEYWLTKQYYVMAQYSRFIRPGYRIIGTSDMNALAAYDAASSSLVVVHDNPANTMVPIRFSLAGWRRIPGAVGVYRTSATQNMARLGAIGFSGNAFTVRVPPQSITTYILSDVSL